MRIQPIPKQKKGPDGEPLCRWCVKPIAKGGRRRTFCSAECVHEAMIRSDPGYLRRMTRERDHGICACCGTDTNAIKARYLKIATVARLGIDGYERLKKKAFKRYGLKPERWWKICHNPTRDRVQTQVEKVRIQAIKAWDHNRKYATEKGILYEETHPDDCPFYAARWRKMIEDSVDLSPQETRLLKLAARFKNLAETRRKRIAADLEAAGFRGSISRFKLTNLWQADHINPVAEGGGSCGLENIQTLCSPCHKRKTADQARRKSLIRRGIDPDATPIPDPQATLNL